MLLLRASDAAHAFVRRLLEREGPETLPIGRSSEGAPLWLNGVAGSLAHDQAMVVAAITRAAVSPGVNVEPAVPLFADVAASSQSPTTISPVSTCSLPGASSSARKTPSYPRDGKILGYEHIRIDLARCEASTVNGRRAQLYPYLFPNIVVLAITDKGRPAAAIGETSAVDHNGTVGGFDELNPHEHKSEIGYDGNTPFGLALSTIFGRCAVRS